MALNGPAWENAAELSQGRPVDPRKAWIQSGAQLWARVMKQTWNFIRNLMRKLIGSDEEGPSSSRLLGIYMSQTNKLGQLSSPLEQTHERRNGRFSHHRRRD